MMAEKIKIAMIKKNVALKDLAAYMGCTSQNLSMKLKQDNLREKELQQMIDEGKEIELNRHFCNTNYTFSVDELKTILKKAQRRK